MFASYVEWGTVYFCAETIVVDMFIQTFKFAKCADYLFEQYTNRVGSEKKKNECDDFESMMPTSN